VLVGSVAIVLVVLRTPSAADADSSVNVTEDSAPVSVGAPSSHPVDSAPPESTSAPTASASASAKADDKKVAVTFKCIPECDRLLVNDTAVTNSKHEVDLLPGHHKVQGFKSGYITFQKTIDVPPGKTFEQEVRLTRLVVAPRPRGKKNCPQFLPCK
jgi:hypothetical protein